MKYTLLQLIQRVLSSIKGEEVNSYDDTAESLVVGDIIKECYYNIISTQDFPELKTLFELTSSGDNTKPTLMYMPTDVIGLEWMKYNKLTLTDTTPNFQYVRYVPLADFMEMVHQFNTSETNVGTFSVTTGLSDNIEFYYRNDKAPDYYTTFDDDTLIFDSYDSGVDTTLQKSKTLCYGLKDGTWEDVNGFIPLLDAQQFNILLKEAKAMAWMELRQTDNAAANSQARKAKIAAEKKKDRVNYDHYGYYNSKYPNYGRK